MHLIIAGRCRRKSRVPPESDIIDIACQAQERVESSVPAPPTVSRTSSFSSLQQQMVPESTRQTIEMVLTAQSPSQLLQLGRNVVSQKLKSQLSGLSGSRNKSAEVLGEGLVYYRPTESPSPGGSFEQLAAVLPVEVNGKELSDAGNQPEVSNHVDNEQSNDCEESTGLTTEVNLIDLSFEDSADALETFANSEDVPSDVDLTYNSAIDPEKTSDQEVAVTNDLVDIQSTTSQSSSSPAPPAILLNDVETSGVRADRPLCRRHSLLKMSHSESSLSMSVTATLSPTPQGATSAHDMRALDIVVDDDMDLAVSSIATGVSGGFSRLLQGGKLAASLMVPRGSGMSAAVAATRRRQLEELAKNRLAKSQLRFKECHTRIILL